MICVRCHRPLKHASPTGMGAVCARRSRIEPVPAHERDLFGYDIDAAAAAAQYRLQVLIDSMAIEASMAMRTSFWGAIKWIRGGRL